MRLEIPLTNPAHLRRIILILASIGALQILAWLSYGSILDGQTIVATLSIITLLNIILATLLYRRFQRFAVMAMIATYFLHALFFLLYFAQTWGRE